MLSIRNTTSLSVKATRAVLAAIVAFSLAIAFSGCLGAKLSVANEQFERGEYFEAQKTYRKIYNKLTKREERPQRGVVAYQMGLCYEKLGMSARASAAFANAIRYQYPDSTAILPPHTHTHNLQRKMTRSEEKSRQSL